jgi:multidrug transporter EmrE-like cation transporter
MTVTLSGILLVALSTVFDSFSQICMKRAAQKTRAAIWISMAVTFSIVEAVVYTYALQILAVGIAFAISGLSFATVTVLARVILKEHVTMTRWIGVALIVTGASMVAAYA